MNLEEEVNHYLARLRDSKFIPTVTAIAAKSTQDEGHVEAVGPPKSESRKKDQKSMRQNLPAGIVAQVASSEDSTQSDQGAVVPSKYFALLKTTAQAPGSSTRAFTPYIEEIIEDANKSNGYSNMESHARAFIAGTRHTIVLETLVPDHNHAQATNGETLAEVTKTVDINADADMDIARHYACSESADGSLSGQGMLAFGKGHVLAIEEDYQVLPPSPKVEEEDWDDCGA